MCVCVCVCLCMCANTRICVYFHAILYPGHCASQILKRYDLVLIQEIRDSSETAIFDLLDQFKLVFTSN